MHLPIVVLRFDTHIIIILLLKMGTSLVNREEFLQGAECCIEN